MKYSLKKIFGLLVLFMATPFLYASESGWTVNPYGYRYDMTLYAQLIVDGAAVQDYSNYEIGAFVNDECRGIGEIQSKDGNTWIYLRIRSNESTGEKIIFKVYEALYSREKPILQTLVFTAQSILGLPSAPFDLTRLDYILGDVNGDGKLTAHDVDACFDIMRGNRLASYNLEAADANRDGDINIVDITSILILMSK